MDNADKLKAFREYEIVDVYAFYDRPVSYACRSRTGEHFIVILTAQTREREEWLIVPVSIQRLQLIRRGDIDLRTAFSVPEDKRAYQVECWRQEETVNVRELYPREIPADLLPAPGELAHTGRRTAARKPPGPDTAYEATGDIIEPGHLDEVSSTTDADLETPSSSHVVLRVRLAT